MSRQSILAAFFALLYLVAMVVPDTYIHATYLAPSGSAMAGALWWLPSAAIVATFAAAQLGIWHNTMFRTFFGLTLVAMLPKLLFALLAVTMGWKVGLAAAAALLAAFLYGFVFGWRRIVVRTATCRSPLVPRDFDGYRIVHLSDLHIGTFLRNPAFIATLADTVSRQRPDMVVFTGDIQNMKPQELYPVQDILAKVKAPDVVYSVLGNHDYSIYTHVPTAVAQANIAETVTRQQRAGWNVLRNEHHIIRRGADSIVVAGEENGGRKPSPALADIGKTLQGIGSDAFVVMLQHDPSVWRSQILPSSNVQLTLSGHTHAGQVSLFGLRPTMLTATEDYGLYMVGNQQLYVTSGLGGVMAMRFGATAEIVVITLHRTS